MFSLYTDTCQLHTDRRRRGGPGAVQQQPAAPQTAAAPFAPGPAFVYRCGDHWFIQQWRYGLIFWSLGGLCSGGGLNRLYQCMESFPFVLKLVNAFTVEDARRHHPGYSVYLANCWESEAGLDVSLPDSDSEATSADQAPTATSG